MIIAMGTKHYSALELIKLWCHAHYGDYVTFILDPVMTKLILAENHF